VNPFKFKKYQALGEDGLADIGKKIENGDIYVNKYCPIIIDN
jgi:DNA-directed RNA polymerase beta subunit